MAKVISTLTRRKPTGLDASGNAPCDIPFVVGDQYAITIT